MTRPGRPKKTDRNRELIEMRDKTQWSFTRIGEFFQISRHQAHKLYQENKVGEGNANRAEKPHNQ